MKLSTFSVPESVKTLTQNMIFTFSRFFSFFIIEKDFFHKKNHRNHKKSSICARGSRPFKNKGSGQGFEAEIMKISKFTKFHKFPTFSGIIYFYEKAVFTFWAPGTQFPAISGLKRWC